MDTERKNRVQEGRRKNRTNIFSVYCRCVARVKNFNAIRGMWKET